MMSTTQTDTAAEALTSDVIARTRASLAQLYAAEREAEMLVRNLTQLPQVQGAIECRRASAAARVESADSPRASAAAAVRAAARELLSLPPQRWCAVLAALRPRQQKTVLQRILATADGFARTQPEHAQRLTDSILHVVRRDRLPRQAPLVRRQLAGRALLVRARALITMRAYVDASPVIAKAHAAFPHQTTYDRYRMHAQLLRGQVLAATGDVADALQTLNTCARMAINYIDQHAFVDALASTAVLLCTHREYATARAAIALAEHVAGQSGNEATLAVLHAALAECAFLGYAPSGAP